MKQKWVRFLSFVLSLSMVFSLAAVAASATEVEQDTGETATETVATAETEETGTDVAEESTDETAADEAAADETAAAAEEETAAATDEAAAVAETEAEADQTTTVSPDVSASYSVNTDEVAIAVASVDVMAVADDSVEVDDTDLGIAAVADELENIEVIDEETGESVALTEEQIATVLNMYQQYLDHWEANADVLGVQTPFYLQYNDDEDSLGILGEMLVLAGYTVDDVRSGNYSYDDLTGMIMNFLYGDMLGVQYYGDEIRDQRDDAMEALEASGAQTDIQKMLVLNDWLATQNTFDMSYIMNASGDDTMVAPTPEKHEHYDDVYAVIYDVYEDSITTQFHDQIYASVEAQFRLQYYQAAIQQIVYQNALTQAGVTEETATDEEKAAANEAAEAYMTENAAAIEEDAAGFVETNFGSDAAAQLSAGADAFIESAETDGVEVAEGVTMTLEEITQSTMASEAILDLDGDGTNETTANDAIPIYAAQAAEGLTDGIIGYWEGTQIGALAEGASVCMGYAKAYAYLLQVAFFEEYYAIDGATDYTVASNWKDADDLYYDESGELDTDADYVVDLVRISFDADVTMYGETQEDFNSDHFWNAVKADGKWYYVDPCYTDVYSEVMIRDRVETDGYMNHVYFMFSDDTARDLYDGYYTEIKTLYEGIATDTTYEDAWFARAKTNVASDGTNMYYVYDSTDIISMLDEYNNSSSGDYSSLMDEITRYKLVMHPITGSDTGDGDTDYTTLIEFNYDEADEDELGVARVYNPSTGEMEENEMLTELYAKHAEQAEIYPSIFITMALYDGKIYFNLSNYILSYDLDTGAVEAVKEYSTVYAVRDDTNAFGGMAFYTTSSASDADFTFENHPIAGICLKDDGQLYVAIATNLGYISGKDDGVRSTESNYTADSDENGYGYEFEESNYNPDYSSFVNSDENASMMESMGYEEEINDNDEFMWIANVVESLSMSSVASATTEYEAVTCEHHYVLFQEQYFTKDDDGNWNTGECYVCTLCGKSVEEPTEPDEDSMMYQMGYGSYEEDLAQYEEDLAEYEAAVAAAGHTYEPTDAQWSQQEDGSYAVTFSALTCSVCQDKKEVLDCLVDDDTVSVTLDEAATVTAEAVTNDDDTVSYVASGEVSGYQFTATYTPDDAHSHTYGDPTWTWADDYSSVTATFTCTEDSFTRTVTATVTSETDEEGNTVYTATAEFNGTSYTDTKTAHAHTYGDPTWTWAEDYSTATATFACVGGDDEQTVEATVTSETTDATCTEDGWTTYTATAVFQEETFVDAESVEIPATGHTYGEATWTWSDDNSTAAAVVTCSVCGNVATAQATVTATTTEATCTEAGETVYTATATIQGETVSTTKSVVLPATGHTYVDGKCTACGEEEPAKFTGMQQGSDGIWRYVVEDEVNTTYTGLVAYDGDLWYVEEGVWNSSYTSLCKYDGVWYYVGSGKVNLTYTGLTKYNNSWWYVKDGVLDRSYTGLVKYNNSWWYVKNGVLDKSYTGLVKYNNSWWYVKSGRLDKSYTGLVKYNNSWWYVASGRLDKSYTGLVKYNNSWWYVASGRLDKSYTGLAKYNHRWWYVKSGRLDRTYSGTLKDSDGKSHQIRNGMSTDKY